VLVVAGDGEIQFVVSVDVTIVAAGWDGSALPTATNLPLP
jgi:hypothetical protein